MHDFRFHEKWWLNWCIVLLIKCSETKLLKSLTEEDTLTLKEVSSMSSYLLSSSKINNIKQVHDFMMMKRSECFSINYDIWLLSMNPINFIILFILKDWYFFTDNISNKIKFTISLLIKLISFILLFFNQ